MMNQDKYRNEDHSFLGCDAMQYRGSSVTFQKKKLFPSSGVKYKPRNNHQEASSACFPEDITSYNCCCENLKSHLVTVSQQ
jgi:hypothetical protein